MNLHLVNSCSFAVEQMVQSGERTLVCAEMLLFQAKSQVALWLFVFSQERSGIWRLALCRNTGGEFFRKKKRVKRGCLVILGKTLISDSSLAECVLVCHTHGGQLLDLGHAHAHSRRYAYFCTPSEKLATN